MEHRKYEVRGKDDLGDLHVFQTDDKGRAEEMVKLMREDLEDVEITTRTPDQPSTL